MPWNQSFNLLNHGKTTFRVNFLMLCASKRYITFSCLITMLQKLMVTFQGLERQLATAQGKYQNFEDVVLEFQRDQEIRLRELETARKQLETEGAKRVQLEKASSNQKAEIAKVKDRNTKLDRELNKALNDLKAREWDVKQLLSKQDKTIVEHVHVLEEAKRVTDRLLQEAQMELRRNEKFIRSLQSAKAKMVSEAEDMAVKNERELRMKEKEVKVQQEKVTQALTDVEKERQGKEEAELQIRRLQYELQQVQHHAEDVESQLLVVQQSKSTLENELDRLAEEAESGDSLAKLQRQYEARIAQLEAQLDEKEQSEATAVNIRERIERQHAELRQLITSSGPTDTGFHSRLLRELQRSDDAFDKERTSRLRHSRSSNANGLQPMSVNTTPRKSLTPKTHPRQSTNSESSRNSERQVAVLKQQVQVLEIQMVASERVRRHLETSIREMLAELENSDGSKQFLQQYRARLSRENAKLAELLQEEAEARRTAEAAQVDGIQAMWTKFQKTLEDERDSYARLEESRKAIVSWGCGVFCLPLTCSFSARSTANCSRRS